MRSPQVIYWTVKSYRTGVNRKYGLTDASKVSHMNFQFPPLDICRRKIGLIEASNPRSYNLIGKYACQKVNYYDYYVELSKYVWVCRSFRIELNCKNVTRPHCHCDAIWNALHNLVLTKVFAKVFCFWFLVFFFLLVFVMVICWHRKFIELTPLPDDQPPYHPTINFHKSSSRRYKFKLFGNLYHLLKYEMKLYVKLWTIRSNLVCRRCELLLKFLIQRNNVN